MYYKAVLRVCWEIKFSWLPDFFKHILESCRSVQIISRVILYETYQFFDDLYLTDFQEIWYVSRI